MECRGPVNVLDTRTAYQFKIIVELAMKNIIILGSLVLSTSAIAGNGSSVGNTDRKPTKVVYQSGDGSSVSASTTFGEHTVIGAILRLFARSGDETVIGRHSSKDRR